MDRLGIVGEKEAAANRAKEEAEKAAEKARLDARLADVNLKIEEVGEGRYRISVRGREVITCSGERNISPNKFNRYWFFIIVQDGKFGIIAIDTEAGAYTQLLPFEYSRIRTYDHSPGIVECGKP